MADHVVGATASGLVELILDKLGMPSFQEIGRVIGVKDDLERLSDTLSAINSVLLDAEEQQITLHSVRNWVRSLIDVAYDIEDVLDLISTHDLEKKAHGERLVQKVERTFRYYSLPRKLKAISCRLDEISANKNSFSFQERQQPLLLTVRERETCSFVQESHVYGREQDREWIVTRLVSSSSQEIQEIPVLSIFGIGGMGKTTLAKLVFNDPKVQVVENFELKLWAYVPNKFDLKEVLHNIIQSATGESSSNLNIEATKNRLHRILSARRFLLVLDNVWIEDSIAWLELKELLEVGSKGSRIMVTTREARVAFIVGTMESYKLKPLTDDHCWSIFVKCAFREGEEKAYPSLVRIGKDIVQKCCGVPLAAKTLGCQLRTVRDEPTWRSIEESHLWKIEQEPNGILPSLKLSFDQLPYFLRPCFSSCSALPKGAFLGKDDVIYRWMALGLLQSENINETLEDIGNKYLNELESRSFFETVHPSILVIYVNQHSGLYKDWPKTMSEMWHEVMHKPFHEKRFVQMHDLVHDLATYVDGQETTFMTCSTNDVSARARHLVWEDEEPLSKREFPRQIQATKKVRSLVFHCRNSNHMSRYFLLGLISNFQCLRILSLEDFEFEDLPNSIGDLKHLRYLHLGNNRKLMRLPDSICKLVNLQTLNVLNCVQLELLPRDLHRLVSLRYLMFTSKVANLLEKCFHGWSSIQEIIIFNCLQLRSLEQIGSLTTLRILRIIHCPCLSSLPESLCYLNHLERLLIQDCQKLDLMGWKGLYGLRSLKDLQMQRLPLLVHFPDGLQSVSRALQHLNIINCQNLIALPECLQHCTSLLHLTLFKCGSLSALPNGIQALKTLQQLCIADCPNLNPRCEREIGADWHLISHIPKIEVDHCFIQNK